MSFAVISVLRTLNELLTAGIAITAFSLLLYALTFNLRDRVARSFAIIMIMVVIVFAADAIGSVALSSDELEFWLKLQWVGIVLLPAAYIQFSDTVLTITGRPSRGRRTLLVRFAYLVSIGFLLTLPSSLLVGHLVQNVAPAPHLRRTLLTWVFSAYYLVCMLLAAFIFVRAYRRTVTSASRRRMGYLLVGGLAPALGSYPYLLFGSGFALRHTLIFWLAAVLSNILVGVVLVVMAYSVAFFGVSWPDRIVKRRLFKWLMRGPVTGSTVLAVTTLVKRTGQSLGFAYSAATPVIMVATILLMEYLITLAAPFTERWLFHGSDRKDIEFIQKLEERLLTMDDLRQFLESVLATVCDRLQSPSAFVYALGMDLFVPVGERNQLEKEALSDDILDKVTQNEEDRSLFLWRDHWLVPLYEQREASGGLLGLLGVERRIGQEIDAEQQEALAILAQRAAMALDDRQAQFEVFSSLEALTPEMEYIQRLRAVSRYNGGASLTDTLNLTMPSFGNSDLSTWVKDALTHYWGGPKLTQNPLLGLKVVQQALDEHEGNPANAMRAILHEAVERIRPEGERRFTAEWILYNILELKFMEGHKVRDVALRLAMSEADLYRKQRVAIEVVARTIMEMEQQANGKQLKTLGAQDIRPVVKMGGLNDEKSTS